LHLITDAVGEVVLDATVDLVDDTLQEQHTEEGYSFSTLNSCCPRIPAHVGEVVLDATVDLVDDTLQEQHTEEGYSFSTLNFCCPRIPAHVFSISS
jgi:hypothetical protein